MGTDQNGNLLQLKKLEKSSIRKFPLIPRTPRLLFSEKSETFQRVG